MDQEEAFAQEARDRPLLDDAVDPDAKADLHFQASEDVDSDNESSPLIGTRLRRPNRIADTRAGESYQRAINEPWTGQQHGPRKPWYQRPSVRSAVVETLEF